MSDNVTPIGCVTKLDIPADQIFRENMGKLESVVMCGYDHDGNEVFISSIADGPDTLWILERMKKMLLEDAPEDVV